jgi:hypothetical protein
MSLTKLSLAGKSLIGTFYYSVIRNRFMKNSIFGVIYLGGKKHFMTYMKWAILNLPIRPKARV